MTVVERVANAISLSFREEGYVEGVSNPAEWQEFLRAARAAIEAMRPELAAVLAEAEKEYPEDWDCYFEAAANGLEDLLRRIDAALSEGDGA